MFYDSKERLRLGLRDLYYYGQSIRNVSGKNRQIFLCNSFPKSGTHMLSQIIQSVNTVNYWNDIVSVQSLSGNMNSCNHIKWKIGSAPNNSIVRSHLFCDPIINDILDRNGAVKFFIYRDLRDVAVSHARWVLNEPRIFLHKIYKSFENFDDCLMASIRGLPLGNPTFNNSSQPNIGEDFKRWRGWLDQTDTYSVKFEDLVGERGGGREKERLKHVRAVLEKLGIPTISDEDLKPYQSMNMNPENSHTFRKGNKGSIGGWRNTFKPEHITAFKTIAGELLIELGYEDNYNW
ncbi:sulfotransferase domain-containing protein [Marivivens sp. LCG002]|uniref:sulfotransferase domain-containing protein n=1 Tax=Marivivens sp. LCG002 TaxID=3051171 RepID=UPI0025577BC8|nr:sulfotransferase domain-containing protein [Marivivens sp. LCG002]WIV49743.1 sulfotransferase domain-containing protein [Marivivens sp. LCG002]